jgi:alpha-tubulin suppressor-like RCC1 family protein
MRVWLSALLFVLVACEAPVVPGTPCTLSSDCRAPLACRLGRCRNECRENRDCANGARCLLDQAGLGACSLINDERCGSGGTECPTGLTCLNDHCVNTCMTTGECPPDGECREAPAAGVSFCFAPDREDGGMPVDAEIDASPDAGRSGPRAIGVGDDVVCVVRDDQHLVCWGSNEFRQLGDGLDATTPRTHDTCGTTDCSLTPVEVLASDGSAFLARDVAQSDGTVCAINDDDGGVYCWGACDEETCGPGIRNQARPFRLFDITDRLATLHGGRSHFCGQTSDGLTWCWGQSGHGQMGLDLSLPYRLELAPAWDHASLAVGGTNTCALFAGGTVRCAGQDDEGALGPAGTLGVDSATPLDVTPFGAAPTDLAAGNGFACALVDTTPWCWGWNALGGLARDSTECISGIACDPMPTPIATTEQFTTLWGEGYGDVSCAGRADHAVYCWGAADLGQSGRSDAAPSRATHVPAFDGAIDVAMGNAVTCAVLASGDVMCMGTNAHGALQMASDALAHPTPQRMCLATPCP